MVWKKVLKSTIQFSNWLLTFKFPFFFLSSSNCHLPLLVWKSLNQEFKMAAKLDSSLKWVSSTEYTSIIMKEVGH